MIVAPFKAEHLTRLALQPAQEYLRLLVTQEHAKAVEPYPGFTALEGDVVLGCAGIVPADVHRAIAWAWLAQDLGLKFIGIHRAVRRFLEVCSYPRVEAMVDCDFVEGHRWMTTLGFELEAPRMKEYRRDGADCALYARVRA